MTASWVTAGATLLLAFITLVYVVLTSRLAKRTAESAQASERAADAAQSSVLVAAMPLVTVQFAGGSSDKYKISVHNDGSIPALNVLVTGQAQGAPLPSATIEIPRLSPGSVTENTLPSDDSPRAWTAARGNHQLGAEWNDPFGHRYCSTREQDASSGERRIRISTYAYRDGRWLALAQG